MSRDTQHHSPIGACGSQDGYTPMQELSLDELDSLPYAGVALALDGFGTTQVSHDASLSAWHMFKLLPAALAP